MTPVIQKMTAEACMSNCIQRGFSFAGVEFGAECCGLNFSFQATFFSKSQNKGVGWHCLPVRLMLETVLGFQDSLPYRQQQEVHSVIWPVPEIVQNYAVVRAALTYSNSLMRVPILLLQTMETICFWDVLGQLWSSLYAVLKSIYWHFIQSQ